MIDKINKSSVYIAYQWGAEKNEGIIKVDKIDGIVLHLNRSEPGSFPVTIRTDGKKIIFKQYQSGNIPDQYNMNYEKVFW